ncbi:MAG TPA: VWA domain-containing protein [Nitrospirales bacterium]|nr:VWA domain-containing protein [Nitrospirales bacterium]
MIHFEWLWAAALLPLPWVVRWVFPNVEPIQDSALLVPSIEDFSCASVISVRRSMVYIPLILAMLAWLLVVLALTRPQWLGDPVALPTTGRDLMLAVDLSGSMEAQDFQLRGAVVDRLTAAKAVAADFIVRRTGDRLGLILFGQKAYIQTPLTYDRETVRTLLMESAIGLAGRETAIGDAIGLAIKRLKKQSSSSRVLILLTDGANTAGEVKPRKAAELAAEQGLKIYTIGIGADEMVLSSLFGSRIVNPSADLDEETLMAIADRTGGRYFRAHNTQELEEIYSLLDTLEPVEHDVQMFRPRSALFYWPLGMALCLASVLVMGRVLGKYGV